MAASSEPEGQDAGACHELAASASSFPKSFPVIKRVLSNASSVSSDAGLAAEQAESLKSAASQDLPNGLRKLALGGPADADGASPHLANGTIPENSALEEQAALSVLPAGKENIAQGTQESPVPNGTPNGTAHHVTNAAGLANGTHGKDAAAAENGCATHSPHAAGDAAGSEAQEARLPAPVVSKTSSSSLKVDSEPFVPSATSSGSSRQATPRSGGGWSGGGLNAHAAAFVPAAAISVATPEPQLRFGDLPESLNATPHISNPDAQEWCDQSGDAADAAYDQEQQWDGDWAGYEGYDPAYAEYAGSEMPQYYQQADGTWVSYWDAGAEAGQWQGYYDGEYAAGYSQQDGYPEGSRSRKPGRGSKRGQERRRPSTWQSAAVDVLETQFGYSKDSLQEMLDLHGGNIELALDMLAQLEAENAGQLSANTQEAPELNEENFPSLGATDDAAPAPAAKAGFAAAVKSSRPAQPAPQPAKPAVDSDARPRSKAEPVPWLETGEAVSQAYADARAVARDHARMRNAYFQEATKAFVAGNKALAKELGAKGREQSDLMKAAHVEASQTIYKHRNPTAGKKGGGGGLLDLHGLHVKEAISILEQEVGEARQARLRGAKGSPRRLSVLVGTGHHTQGSRTPARLPAAVEDWLKASQIHFTTPVPGLLEISP